MSSKWKKQTSFHLWVFFMSLFLSLFFLSEKTISTNFSTGFNTCVFHQAQNICTGSHAEKIEFSFLTQEGKISSFVPLFSPMSTELHVPRSHEQREDMRGARPAPCPVSNHWPVTWLLSHLWSKRLDQLRYKVLQVYGPMIKPNLGAYKKISPHQGKRNTEGSIPSPVPELYQISPFFLFLPALTLSHFCETPQKFKKFKKLNESILKHWNKLF